MTFTLRPYQQKFVDDIRIKLFKHERIIACSATGSGKTKTFLAITKMAISKGKTVLIISEARKIFKQIKDEVKDATYIESKIKHLNIKPNYVFVAMAQTLAKRPFILQQLADLGKNLLVIIDEAHIATPFSSLLEHLKEKCLHIGFTATPNYKDAKHLPSFFNDIAVGAQPQELVEMGFLVPYVHFERKVANLSGLKKDSKGDFTERSQEEAFEKKEVFDGVFEDIKKFPYKKAVVFCSSIKHAEDTAVQFRANGYKVAVVHSKNKQSDFELFQFQDLNSGIDVCISVGSLTKGWDFPPIDLVILLRATTSLSLYLQMCGRGSRLSEFTGKTIWRVLDYGGNGSRHLPWNFEHDWSKLWKGKKKSDKEGVAPVKECPGCGALVHASTPVCGYCGHVFVKAPPTKKETELIELNTSFNSLRGRKISTLTPEELVIYAKSTNKKAYAARVAKAKNDIQFLLAFASRLGYKESWAYMNHTDEKIDFFDITIK